jgi:hypothetical protein
MAIDIERLCELLDQLVRELRGAFGLRNGNLQKEELISADPRKGIAVSGSAAHPLGGLLQDKVPCVVTVRVVDVLEAIEINAEDCDRVTIFLCLRKLSRHDLMEQSPIGQVSKRIAMRKPVEVRVELLHLLAHHLGGVVVSPPLEVGLEIRLADHIEEAGDIDVTTVIGDPCELVGKQPMHCAQPSASASETIVMVWL